MFHSANCWKKRPVRAKQPRQQDSSLDHQQHLCKERTWDQTSMGERLAHAAGLCSSPTGKAARTTASKGLSQRVQQSQVALTDSHPETRNASLGERGHCHYRSVSFKLASLGSNCSFQGKQLLLARGSLVGKFKCKAVI